MTDNAMLTIRIPPELKKALATAAVDDHRTMSSMLVRIVAEWLEANGYVKPKRKGGRQ